MKSMFLSILFGAVLCTMAACSSAPAFAEGRTLETAFRGSGGVYYHHNDGRYGRYGRGDWRERRGGRWERDWRGGYRHDRRDYDRYRYGRRGGWRY